MAFRFPILQGSLKTTRRWRAAPDPRNPYWRGLKSVLDFDYSNVSQGAWTSGGHRYVNVGRGGGRWHAGQSTQKFSSFGWDSQHLVNSQGRFMRSTTAAMWAAGRTSESATWNDFDVSGSRPWTLFFDLVPQQATLSICQFENWPDSGYRIHYDATNITIHVRPAGVNYQIAHGGRGPGQRFKLLYAFDGTRLHAYLNGRPVRVWQSIGTFTANRDTATTISVFGPQWDEDADFNAIMVWDRYMPPHEALRLVNAEHPLSLLESHSLLVTPVCPTEVVQYKAEAVPSLGDPDVITLDAATEAGTALVLGLSHYAISPKEIVEITDSAGGTLTGGQWTLDHSGPVLSDDWEFHTYSRYDVPAGITSVTLTFDASANHYGSASLYEVRGLDPALKAEDSNSFTGNTEPNFSIPLTASRSHGFLIGSINRGGVNNLIGYGYTRIPPEAENGWETIIHGVAAFRSGTVQLEGRLTSNNTNTNQRGVLYGAMPEKRFGQTGIGAGSGPASSPLASVFTTPAEPENLMVSSIIARIWGTSATANVRAAIYADDGAGNPGALVAQSTNEIAADTTPLWRTFSFANVQLSPSTPYWLAVSGGSQFSVNFFNNVTGGNAVRHSTGYSYPTWPDPYGGHNDQDIQLSIHAAYEVAAEQGPVAILFYTNTTIF